MKSREARYWEDQPAAELLAEVERGAVATSGGHLLTRTYGTCMWPGIREGDLIFYVPLADEALAPLVGQIAVARSSAGSSVAHRIQRVSGPAGRERVVLKGDLAWSDAPRRRAELLGVAKALYRPGRGFVDLPESLEVGPAGGALLQLLGRFFTWAERRASAPRARQPSATGSLR
jgi:hypothetical protein